MSAATNKVDAKRRGLRIPIRYKMLLAASSALLIAIGLYGYLAVNLYVDDKVAYIFDSNVAAVEGMAEQTRAALDVLEKELALVALRGRSRKGANAGVDRAGIEELFKLERDMVRVQLWVPRSGGPPRLSGTHTNDAALETTELTRADLDRIRKERPIPFDAVMEGERRLYVHNSSLPPSAAVLTVAYRRADEGLIIVADILHDRLLRVLGRSEHHEAFIVDERGEVVAHPTAAWVVERRDLSTNPLVREALASGAANGVKEFTGSDGETYLGAYGRVGTGRLWAFTQIPKSVALRASQELTRRTVLFAIAVLLLAFIATIFTSRIITSPIRRLRAATETIGQGRFDVAIDVNSRDEIGDLAQAFTHMAVALKEVQGQLIQSEKLAAFGQLGAGITHEVKNPMTGIVSFAQLAQRKLDDKEKLSEFLKLIEKEALRCRDILVNFLKFARSGGARHEPIDPNELVEAAATILRHQLNIHNVRLETELGEGLPAILGSPPELQQVILNLSLNAQQAMPKGGRVTLRSRADGSDVLIDVIDEGPGIPAEIQAKIFEPFFTTKESGKGTGLGLSVSFGILQGHHGKLSVASVMGQGATFTLRIPAATDERIAAAAAAPVATTDAG